MQIVQNKVAAYGASNVWLAGHSLGSAIGMLVGKNIYGQDGYSSGSFSFLFTPPFISVLLPLIESINNKTLKDGIQIVTSFVTTGITAAKNRRLHPQTFQLEDPFVAISQWVPGVFVNRDDLICSGYIGYFERRRTMEAIGAGRIERIDTQNSMLCLILNSLRIERITYYSEFDVGRNLEFIVEWVCRFRTITLASFCKSDH